MPFMTGLPAALLAAWGAQTAGRGLLQPIAGRWLAAVTAILCLLIFQRLNSGFQVADGSLLLLDEGHQPVKERKYRGFPLLVSGAHIFAGGQIQRCHRFYYSWLLSVLREKSVKVLYA